MSKGLKSLILRLATGFAALNGGLSAGQESPPPEPATVPATTTTQRLADVILDDYQRVNEEVRSLVQSPDELLDPARREAIGARAVPELKRLLLLADELATAGAAGQQFAPQLRSGVDSVLAVFADAEAIARLQKLSVGGDAAAALQAKCALAFGDWVRANRDAAVQSRLLDDIETLAKANPQEDNLAVLLLQLSEAGPATLEIRARARTIATTTLTGEMAQQIRQQIDSDTKLAELEGKPLTVVGTRHTGEAFGSDVWKGKVVLVDFAISTWPPSRNNTDQLKKLYGDFHDRGLEIITISCDESLDDLKKFLTENPEVVWPQLFDANTPGWHAIAKQLNVTDPSTAILIDRNGIVTTVKARESLNSLVLKLISP